MARTHRPILDAAAGNVLAMIALHQDRPCPTNAEIREWTGVSRRRVAPFLADLAARGIIEVETEIEAPSGPPRRRMRAVGGVWTGWTLRGCNPARPIPAAAEGNVLAMIARHRDRPCPTVAEIVVQTGVPRGQLQSFLAGLATRGVIEVESRCGGRRRLRASGGAWTGWTARRGSSARAIPSAAEDEALAMIIRHRDRPCPTVAELVAATGVSRGRIASFLARMAARGLIEIEGGIRPGALRRMRPVGGAWTDWTRGYRVR